MLVVYWKLWEKALMSWEPNLSQIIKAHSDFFFSWTFHRFLFNWRLWIVGSSWYLHHSLFWKMTEEAIFSPSFLWRVKEEDGASWISWSIGCKSFLMTFLSILACQVLIRRLNWGHWTKWRHEWWMRRCFYCWETGFPEYSSLAYWRWLKM